MVPVNLIIIQLIFTLLSINIWFRENALQVVHPLGRLLCSPCPDNLKNLALKILCHLIYHIGSEYAIFIPVIVCFYFLLYFLNLNH